MHVCKLRKVDVHCTQGMDGDAPCNHASSDCAVCINYAFYIQFQMLTLKVF